MITTSLPKKLKVLVCAYACLGESGVKVKGGEAVLGWNIIKQLARFHQVFVLTHSENLSVIEKSLEKEPISNVKFYYLDLPFLNFLQRFSGGIQFYAYLWQIKAYFFAKKLHQKFRFDTFHHITYANDWMASFIGALLPIPYIRGPGGGAHSVPKNFLSEFSFKDRLFQYLRSFGQWLFRHDPFFILGQKRAKAILVCNRESFEAIPKKWQNKTYLFPVNGISKEDLDLLKSKEAEISENKYSHGRIRIPERSEVALFACNKFKVLSAGKLLPIKGFSLAIKAFKIFSDKFPETEFEIIGDGPELARLKNLVSKLAIEDKVKFKNWLPRDEFLKELTSCDVFLFPSLRDGGGQVVVEAMAAQKPVICLDIAGPGFHINNNWGIKIKPDFPEKAIKEMAEALEKLYFDKELRFQLGKLARERAEKEYLWDNLGEKLFKIYQEVLK
jgi:glycosyltransferase involved in cell wall biosynthesis